MLNVAPVTARSLSNAGACWRTSVGILTITKGQACMFSFRRILVRLFQPLLFRTSSKPLALTARSSLAPPCRRAYGVIRNRRQRSCLSASFILCHSRARKGEEDLLCASGCFEHLQYGTQKLMACHVQRHAGVALACFARLPWLARSNEWHALPPDPDHDPVPRRLYPKQRDFMAHGTSDRCPGCRASVVAVHRATPRNVEFALKENSGSQSRKPVFAPHSQSSGCSHACIEESSVCGTPGRQQH